MPQVAQLNLFLDLRRRILAHEFDDAERLTATRFMGPGLTRPATLGVLNALATGGYLNKHHNWYTRAVWTADSIFECTDRLEVLVEICATRVIHEQGPRLLKLQGIAVQMAETDPSDEAFYLRSIDWLGVLFEAGERRAIGEVAYKLVPQAYYRILWNLITAKESMRKVVRTISRNNVDAFEGDVSQLRENQSNVYADLRRAIEVAFRADPLIKFDLDDLLERNQVRESDVRGRTLALTHPAYPLYLGVDRNPAPALPLVVQ